MAVLWTILNILVVFLYFELPGLKEQESLTSEITYPRRLDSNCISDSIENISVNSPLLDENYTISEEQIVNNFNPMAINYGSIQQPPPTRESSCKAPVIPKRRDRIVMPGTDMTTSDEMIESAELILSTSCPQRTFQERLYHQIEESRRAKSVPIDHTSSESQEIDRNAVTSGDQKQNYSDIDPANSSNTQPQSHSSGNAYHEHSASNGNVVNISEEPLVRTISRQLSGKFHIPLRYIIQGK